MNRKQFIESQGGICRNWTWSWSFINKPQKVIIFGEWDTTQERHKALILDEAWEISRRGRKQPGYYQAREHIRLVEEGGYQLMTFPMVYSDASEGDGTGPSRIASFTPQLSPKSVVRISSRWYASDQPAAVRLPEELTPDEALKEGASQGRRGSHLAF
jgi:5-methylcytosine-specific restriction protein A